MIKGLRKKKTNFDEVAFWEQAEKDRKIVATWPKWKQKIIISAHTASTGQYIMSEKEWRKQYGKEK